MMFGGGAAFAAGIRQLDMPYTSERVWAAIQGRPED
jgi:hypothetical protein